MKEESMRYKERSRERERDIQRETDRERDRVRERERERERYPRKVLPKEKKNTEQNMCEDRKFFSMRRESNHGQLGGICKSYLFAMPSLGMIMLL